MSKLIFTNTNSVLSGYQNTAISGGYKCLIKKKLDSFTVQTYKKLCVDNQNFFDSPKGFVAAVGTYIYKGKTDAEALSMILEDFDGDIISIRDNILGNFLLIIRTESRCYFCSDKNGLFDVYFFQSPDGTIAVSNTLYELCEAIPQPLTVNELNCLEQVFQIAILGNDTIVDEVKRLFGYEYIQIDLDNSHLDVVNVLKSPEYSFDKGKNIQEHVVEFCQTYEQYAKSISDVFDGDVAISATGGLDARMVLSGFLKNNVHPTLYSGEGNSVLSTTRTMDTKIVSMIADGFGLEQKVMSWKTAEPVNRDWEKYIQRYGFFAGIYGGSEDTMNSFETVSNRFITHGFFGEMYRTLDFVQSYAGKENTMKLDDYIDNYYIDKRVQSYISPDSYKRYRQNIKDKFKRLLLNYDIQDDRLTADMCQALVFEYRRNADSRFVNFCNRQRYSIAIIGEHELLKHSFLPMAIKSNATFIVRAINLMEPQLLNFPLYSTCKVDYINKENMTVETKNVVGSSTITSFLRQNMKYKWAQKLYFKLSIAKKFLVGDKKVALEQRNSLRLAVQLNTIISNYRVFEHDIDASTSNDMSRMSRYAIMLLIINNINSLNEQIDINLKE